jgi:hypothetical protein
VFHPQVDLNVITGADAVTRSLIDLCLTILRRLPHNNRQTTKFTNYPEDQPPTYIAQKASTHGAVKSTKKQTTNGQGDQLAPRVLTLMTEAVGSFKTDRQYAQLFF